MSVLRTSALLLLSLLPLPSAHALSWGANVHDGGPNPEALAKALAERGMTVVRTDLWGNDAAFLARWRRAVTLFRDHGIAAQAVLFTSFSGGQPRSRDYGADLAEVEQTAYNQTLTQVEASRDLVRDYELQNEIPLYPDMMVKGDKVYGQETADWDTPACRLQAAVLRGMSRAVAEARRKSGQPLRIILGTVNRYYGFLRFMREQRVEFDVVGYHIYPWEKHRTLDDDPWFGEGGPLGQLAQFGKPITLNEFNAGEIYAGAPGHPGPNYENKLDDPQTELGYKGVNKHLRALVAQTAAKLESVVFYEAFDEPRKEAPENRFGLFYDTDATKPKLTLLLAAAYAGGKLSPAEQDLLRARGLGPEAK